MKMLSKRLQLTILALSITGLGAIAYAAGMAPSGESGGDYNQSDLILLIIYVLLALVFSFLCSVAEAVLLSITPSFIAGLQETDPKRAQLIKRLKQENIDRSLAAILTLNTIAHTVGAIGSGSKATAVFGSAWFGVFSAVMTLLILFLSEIIPKTLGAVYWRNLSGITARFVQFLILSLYPLIIVSEMLTRLVAQGKSVHAFNRDEFVAMAGVGEQGGHITEHESRIIRNLFCFNSLKASDIMTPSTVIAAIDESTPLEEVLDDPKIKPFSRLPVYHGSIDEITGFVIRSELLLAKAEGREDATISNMKRELPTVSAETPLSDLLEFLLDNRQQIARVTREYGETDGLVTLEDVIETLLGMEIVDENDQVADMQALARRKWERRAKNLGLEIDNLMGTEKKQEPTEAPASESEAPDKS